MESGLDLKAQSVDALFALSPQSALGLFWLQAHFPAEEWDVLLNGQAVFSADCYEAIVADARVAGLAVEILRTFALRPTENRKQTHCLVL